MRDMSNSHTLFVSNSNNVGIMGVAVVMPKWKTLPSYYRLNLLEDTVTWNHVFSYVAHAYINL